MRKICILLAAALQLCAQRQGVYPAAKGGGDYTISYYFPAAASTPWRPAWSPDGRDIAFAMSGSIWKIRLGDTTAYELTANATYDSSPAWSPDGSWIAYTADDDGKSIGIRLLNVRTGESTALTSGSQVYLDPVWSPDGKRLAYVSTAPSGWFNIFVMPVENGVAGAPMQITADHQFGRPRLYFNDNDLNIEPTWSPDGKEIICLSNRGIPLGSGGVWRFPVEPDGMSKGRLILQEQTLFRTIPQWSRDGKRILYSSHRGAQFTNLYVLPAVGGEPYQLTFGEWDHFEPRWSPDGEWIVYVSNQHGLSDLRVLRTFGGDERRIEIHKRVYLRPMGKVEVTIRDLSANAVTPARMYARAADGKTYAPVDSFQRISPRTNQYFFHMAGKSTLEVPAGRLELEATKGFEFWTKAQTIEVKAGEVTRVELGLERLANLKAEGWYNGSNHIHMNYGGNLHNTPENMMFMAAAEDNDVVGDQICNKDNRVFDRQFFTGAPDPRSTPDRLLYFNQEYRPPFYGHVSLINLTRNLISPFTTGYEGTAIESLYPSNTDMFRLAREQGAIGGYVHPWFGDPVKSKYAGARGFPVDLALGTTEYLEVLPSATGSNWAADVWHRALNCGFRITGTGGEDSISSLHRTAIVGSDRTYAYLGNQLNYATWIQAFRAGRTFFSNGPLLDFRMDLNRPGAEIRLPAEGGTIELYGRVQSVAPVEKFEVVNNGQVIESVAVPSPGNAAEIRKSISVSKSGWYTLRAMGSKAKRPVDDEFPFAETSPIYVYCGNQTIRSRADAEYFIRWIDEITRQAEEHPGWRSDAEKKSVLAQFATARKEFEKRASEAK